MPANWCWRCIFFAMFLFWAVVASLLFGNAYADVTKTFLWDNVARCSAPDTPAGCWPEGTTVELVANGVSFQGLDGTTMPSGSATVTLPINPGQQIDAIARAVASDGRKSGWSNRVYVTLPMNPINPWLLFAPIVWIVQ